MEIDKLPPEVAEAIESVTRWMDCDQDWATLQTYLRRLAEENARLARTNIALTAERDHAKLLRLKAESERDALRARIAESGKAECRDDGDLNGPALIAYMAEEDVGRTFALLKLEDGE